MLDRTSQQSLQATRPKTRFAYLYVKQEGRTRCIASNHFGEFALTHLNLWDWVCGHVCGELGCKADDLTCVEGEDGDMIALNGKVIGELVED